MMKTTIMIQIVYLQICFFFFFICLLWFGNFTNLFSFYNKRAYSTIFRTFCKLSEIEHFTYMFNIIDLLY